MVGSSNYLRGSGLFPNVLNMGLWPVPSASLGLRITHNEKGLLMSSQGLPASTSPMVVNKPLMLTPASKNQPPESWFGPGGCGGQQAAQVDSFCQQPTEVGHGSKVVDGHRDLAQDLRTEASELGPPL